MQRRAERRYRLTVDARLPHEWRECTLRLTRCKGSGRNLALRVRYGAMTDERFHPLGMKARSPFVRLNLSAEHTMSRNTEEATNSYVTDMLALEEHILTAVQGQRKDLKNEHPMFGKVLQDIEATATRHTSALNALVDQRDIGAGGSLAEVLKKAGSVVLGAGAAAIDMVRSERVPKNLRDDYTVLALATVGYAMLFTTAKSLGDAPVATLAASHHKDYAEATMALDDIVPASVVLLLKDEGLPADSSVIEAVNKELDSHWRE